MPETLAKPDFAPVADARANAETGESAPREVVKALAALQRTRRMPALFLGHGSPMNALADNDFTHSLIALAAFMPRPAAVLVVSAHWLTRGETRVLSAPEPRTIHDFAGFPEELSAVEYPAPGAPEVAAAVAALTGSVADAEWGLDHASWTLLRHMYPDADVPVLELSLDMDAEPRAHVELARRLAPLRERGVLVVGSGNIVHNLALLDWTNESGGLKWAIEFDEWARDRVKAGNVNALVDYAAHGDARLAVPTADHYLPLLYALALREAGEPISFTHEGMAFGSISMRCVRVG